MRFSFDAPDEFQGTNVGQAEGRQDDGLMHELDVNYDNYGGEECFVEEIIPQQSVVRNTRRSRRKT